MENEMEITEINKDSFLHEQIAEQDNEELKQSKHQYETEPHNQTNVYKIKQQNKNDNKLEKENLIAYNSFQMRRKLLAMDVDTIKTFFNKELIENDDGTSKKIDILETNLGTICAALDTNNFTKAENDLLTAENLSTDLMKKIKNVVNRKTVQTKEVKEPVEEIDVPDYRSIVTVRGTKEDVANCILKAKTAFENCKYDRAESLLLKAERIFPTKNARDLLKQVRVAKEPKQNHESIEQATEAVEQVISANKEESKSEADTINVFKCLTAFEKAFTAGNLEKAERILNKAKRFDPSLDIEEKLSLIRTAVANKLMEERRKEEIAKAERERQKVGKCLYMAIKAYDEGYLFSAEQSLLEAKNIDPTLNLVSKLSKIRNKITSKSTADIEVILNTGHNQTVTESDIEFAADFLYKAQKACDIGNFTDAENNLRIAKTFDPSLNLESFASKCRAKIASRSSTEGATVNEAKRAKSCYEYPSTMVRTGTEMPVYTEKYRVENQAKPSHEITTSETKFSCLEDEKQTEIDMQIERQTIQEIEKIISKVKKDDEKDKDKLVKNAADGDKLGKDYKKETSNKIELESKDKFVNNNSNKREQPENLISMAEKDVHDAKLDNAMDFLNTAEELHPTARAKELLKNIGNLSREEPYVLLNCYEFPVETNESNEASALKCFEMAQYAFKGDEYDRAEHFLLKSLRICDSKATTSFLETVRNAKAQNNNKETVKTEQINNEHVDDDSLNEKNNEYKKCMDLATNAMAVGNLPKAERFFSKSIRINPNDEAKKQLQHVQDIRASELSSNEATANTPKYDDDSKLARRAEMFVNLAVDAMNCYKFYIARHNLQLALQILPNKRAETMLQDVNNTIDRGRKNKSNNDFKFEANRLLDIAGNCIKNGDLETVESLLIVSWDMNISRRTTLVYNQFLNARLALLKKEVETNNTNSVKLFDSDRLVVKALDKYHNDKFKEAKELLTSASQFYPSDLIDKLLVVIEKKDGFFSKMYKKTVEKLF